MSNHDPILDGLAPELCQALTDLGYTTLTPIQKLSLPPLLAGRDLIGQSQTGSGKTAAFSLPVLQQVDTSVRTVQALVLCPTRELVTQVVNEMRRLGRYKKDFQVLPIFGGQPMFFQRRSLEHGTQVVVGTPGRIMDHLRRKSLDLSQVRVVVLDEADRMLDMGFVEAMETILSETPSERQTILFSATYPPTIESISRRFQNNPEQVCVEAAASEMPAIEQIGYRTNQETKLEALLAVLAAHPVQSALIFCNQKIVLEEVALALRDRGFGADRLHGDMEQRERDAVLAKFRNGTIRILVASDVAARGLDIGGLDAVVNFDLPRDPSQYVHRIGRTGRAGATGLAISFVNHNEGPRVERLAQYTGGKKLQVLPVPTKKSAAAPVVSTQFSTLSIAGGRKEKLRPGDILGALTGDAGIPGTHVGKIEVQEHVAYVAIDRASFQQALTRLKNGKIKNRKFLVRAVS